MKKTPAATPRLSLTLPAVACAMFLMAPTAQAKFPFTVGEIDKTPGGFCTFHDRDNPGNIVTVTPEMFSPDSNSTPAPIITMTGANGTLTIMPAENTVNFVPTPTGNTKPAPSWSQPTNSQLTIANAFITACTQTQPNQPDLTVSPNMIVKPPASSPSQTSSTGP